MNKEMIIESATEIADTIRVWYATRMGEHERNEIYELVYDVLMENGWNGYE